MRKSIIISSSIIFVVFTVIRIVLVYTYGGTVQSVTPPFYIDVIMDIIISILAGIAIAIEINEKQRTTPIGIIAIIVQVVSIAEILIYMNNYNVVPLYITAGILVLLGVMQFIKNRINLMASYCLWVICIAVMIEYIPLFLIGC